MESIYLFCHTALVRAWIPSGEKRPKSSHHDCWAGGSVRNLRNVDLDVRYTTEKRIAAHTARCWSADTGRRDRMSEEFNGDKVASALDLGTKGFRADCPTLTSDKTGYFQWTADARLS